MSIISQSKTVQKHQIKTKQVIKAQRGYVAGECQVCSVSPATSAHRGKEENATPHLKLSGGNHLKKQAQNLLDLKRQRPRFDSSLKSNSKGDRLWLSCLYLSAEFKRLCWGLPWWRSG